MVVRLLDYSFDKQSDHVESGTVFKNGLQKKKADKKKIVRDKETKKKKLTWTASSTDKLQDDSFRWS